jgi:spore coat polysaccharide biosynthesis protein SpsF
MICIIQARTTSTRLKNKILQKINNESIIEWVIKRAKKIKSVKKIILAIPKNSKQKKLITIAKKHKCEVFMGSENNVVKRFYDLLKKLKTKDFLRICSDNPFICHEEIEHLIRYYKKNKLDYAFNTGQDAIFYVDGVGAEISNVKTLKKISNKAKSKEEKEHVFLYLKNNLKKFKISKLKPLNNFYNKPYLKIDVDYLNQLKFFQKLKINSSMKSTSIIKKILAR